MVTPRVKHIEVNVCFTQDQFEKSLFFPNYEESSVIPTDMCTKIFSGTIISRSTKWMTGHILYPTSDTEHY